METREGMGEGNWFNRFINLKLATQFIAGIPKGSGIDTGTWRTSGRAKKKTKTFSWKSVEETKPQIPYSTVDNWANTPSLPEEESRDFFIRKTKIEDFQE